SFFDFDYKKAKVLTNSKSGTKGDVLKKDDEAYVFLDCAVELTLPTSIPDVLKFWLRGEYFPGNFQKTKDQLQKAVKNFVLSTQRNVAGKHTYKEVGYSQYVIERDVNTIFLTKEEIPDPAADDGSTIKNEFKFLGITNLKYVLSDVSFSDGLEKVLDKLAIAQNEGEATLADARYASEAVDIKSKGDAKAVLRVATAEAKGDQKKLKAIEDHLQAATVRALNDTSNVIFSTEGADNLPSIILKGGK
ncbi:MAG: hypothetical protein ABH884_01125, partial [Candidatus Komeilibacteria bacterium]